MCVWMGGCICVTVCVDVYVCMFMHGSVCVRAWICDCVCAGVNLSV